MTPQEKAKELFSLYRYAMSCTGLKGDDKDKPAKSCAIILVDEIIQQFTDINNDFMLSEQINYWQQVKEEIQKL